MSLYQYYRGPVDPDAVYIAWAGDLEVEYKLEPGEVLASKGVALFRQLYGRMPIGTRRVR